MARRRIAGARAFRPENPRPPPLPALSPAVRAAAKRGAPASRHPACGRSAARARLPPKRRPPPVQPVLQRLSAAVIWLSPSRLAYSLAATRAALSAALINPSPPSRRTRPLDTGRQGTPPRNLHSGPSAPLRAFEGFRARRRSTPSAPRRAKAPEDGVVNPLAGDAAVDDDAKAAFRRLPDRASRGGPF